MTESITAFMLGALTVVHPCPLATNIAALAVLSSLQYHGQHRFGVGILFVSTEIAVFIVLAAMVAGSVSQINFLANFLQQNLLQLLGPVVILLGMFLSGLLSSGKSIINLQNLGARWHERYGAAGAILLGLLVALSFCPFSAAMFFGVLVPLAIARKQTVLLPLIYGLGAALPLSLMAVGIASAPDFLRKFAGVKSGSGRNVQNFIGGLCIVLGIYMTLHFVFRVG